MSHGMRMGARRRQKRARVVRLIALSLFLAAAAGALVMAVRLLPGTNAFYRGISVDGIDLGGQRRQNGEAQVNAQARQRLESLRYTLRFMQREWTVLGTQLGAAVDSKPALEAAWSAGHEGDWFSRFSQINRLWGNPLELFSAVEYNRSALETFVSNVKLDLDRPVLQTRVFVASEMQLEYEPGEDGYELDAARLTGELSEKLRTLTSAEIELSDMVSITRPDKPPEHMEASVKLLFEYYTEIRSSNPDRTSNIRRALEPFNGLAVEPGDEVDFNKRVGPRTEKNGFLPAPQFGDEGLVDGIGGGVCQASTTLYNAALLSDMTIIKRRPHSRTVGYVEYSRDAAVTYEGKNPKNLIFRNDTQHTLYFTTDVTSKRAAIRVYGTTDNPDIGINVISRELDVIPQGETTVPDDLQYDDYRVVEPGQPAIKSQAFRVYYDTRTEQTLKTEDLGIDEYAPIKDRVIVGTVPRNE